MKIKLILVFVPAVMLVGCATLKSFRVVTDVRFDQAKIGIYNATPFYGKIFAQADTARPLCVIGPHEAVQGSAHLWMGYAVLALVVPMYSDPQYHHWIGTAMAVMRPTNGQFTGWSIQTVYFPDGTCKYYGSAAYPPTLIGTGRRIDFPDTPNRTTAIVQLPNFTAHDACVITYWGRVAEPWNVHKTWIRPGGFYAKEEAVGYRSYATSYSVRVDYVDARGRVVARRNLGCIYLYGGPSVTQLWATPSGFGY